MTSTCWLWSTLEKACLKRAMALHRDSGRSEAACAKAVAADQLVVTWGHLEAGLSRHANLLLVRTKPTSSPIGYPIPTS